MRLLIIIFLTTTHLWAKSSEDVVKEYTEFISNPKTEKIESLFSKKFIKNFGGKEKLNTVFINARKNIKPNYKIKKVGHKDDKEYVELSSGKHKVTYILKKEGEFYKIDGTIKAE